MKHLVKLSGLGVMCVLLGTIAPAYAQEDQHPQQDKSSQNAKQQQRVKKAKPDQHAQQQDRTHQKQEVQQARPEKQAQRASNNGRRIPDDRFRARFGRQHAFRINRPVMVSGAARFQYGGYWFGFVDPWPVGWYYTDQVYVDYIDGGYYLLSPVHPGVQISISVVL